MLIPLLYFVDHTDPLLPKGRITISGLSSPLSNPLISATDSSINFRSQIIFNSRPRDLVSWPRNMETVRGAYLGVQSYGTHWTRDDEGMGDDGTVDAGTYEGMQLKDEYSLMSGKDTIVYVAAIKIVRDVPWSTNTRAGTKLGFGKTTSGGHFFLYGSSGSGGVFYGQYSHLAGDPYPVVTTFTSSSYNKWMLVAITFKAGDISKCNIYLKGGQYASLATVNASLLTSFNLAGITDPQILYAPGGSAMWGGFATAASYTGNNDAGLTGLETSHIDWNVFDAQHVCDSYLTVGNRIYFKCQNEVAWDIKVGGQWVSTQGVAGTANRVFYDTGTYTIDTPVFTEIRPVLKNSGDLNSDVLASLTWVDVSDTRVSPDTCITASFDSSSLNYRPINHNITPERVVFCYRNCDADSVSVAEAYCSARGVPDINFLALDVPETNSITEQEFASLIETPIINKLISLGHDFSVNGNKQIYAIILGYNVPRIISRPGKQDVAVASRLHRLNNPLEEKFNNPTFDRKTWTFYDLDDNEEVFVTAVIDGPTVQDALNLISRSIDIDNQQKVTGNISLDPYGKKVTQQQIEYQGEVVDFYDLDFSSLGLESVITVNTEDPYEDPIVKELSEDSFYWGWFTDRTSPQMFKHSQTKRVFCYNADDDGAANLKEDTSEGGRWVTSSICASNPGYAASAGAIGRPGEDGYLYPRPFFEALHRGASLGEAFLCSSKYVNWKNILVGDPLMVVRFPLAFSEKPTPNPANIRRMIRNVEQSIAHADRITRLSDHVINNLYFPNASLEQVDVFYSLVNWRTKVQGNIKDRYPQIVSSLCNYVRVTTGERIDEWLVSNSVSVSNSFAELVLSSCGVDVSTLVLSPGYWEVEFVYERMENKLENVEFTIDVASDSSFSNLITTVYSMVSKTGWFYEKEPGEFYRIPDSGLPSNYSGRRVRYEADANNLLDVNEEYYVRWSVDTKNQTTILDSKIITME